MALDQSVGDPALRGPEEVGKQGLLLWEQHRLRRAETIHKAENGKTTEGRGASELQDVFKRSTGQRLSNYNLKNTYFPLELKYPSDI